MRHVEIGDDCLVKTENIFNRIKLALVVLKLLLRYNRYINSYI